MAQKTRESRRALIDTTTDRTARILHRNVITSPQSARIDAEPGGRALNFRANNYLGLADHPDLAAAVEEVITGLTADGRPLY